ncbi:MAG TPA: hypothetical protein PLP27_05550 [Crocinitomicaceae bacterium]|nr:hypothetical protein [Crocinitomicaceae bacterium]
MSSSLKISSSDDHNIVILKGSDNGNFKIKFVNVNSFYFQLYLSTDDNEICINMDKEELLETRDVIDVILNR